MANASLETARDDGESAKSRIAAVRQTLTTSAWAATDARKAFGEGSKRELEKSQECVATHFSRVTDASDKAVEDSPHGLDEPTTADDASPAS